MAKYLKEIDLYACELYDEGMRSEFMQNTLPYIERVNSKIKRNIEANFRKIVVMLWPPGKVSDDLGIVPSFEFDSTSNVGIINLEYDLALYADSKSRTAQDLIARDILENAFIDIPVEFGLDAKYLEGLL